MAFFKLVDPFCSTQLSAGKAGPTYKGLTRLGQAHLSNRPTLRSTDLVPYLHLQNPLKAVPRLVFDGIAGRRCVYTRAKNLQDHLRILSLIARLKRSSNGTISF